MASIWLIGTIAWRKQLRYDAFAYIIDLFTTMSSLWFNCSTRDISGVNYCITDRYQSNSLLLYLPKPFFLVSIHGIMSGNQKQSEVSSEVMDWKDHHNLCMIMGIGSSDVDDLADIVAIEKDVIPLFYFRNCLALRCSMLQLSYCPAGACLYRAHTDQWICGMIPQETIQIHV